MLRRTLSKTTNVRVTLKRLLIIVSRGWTLHRRVWHRKPLWSCPARGNIDDRVANRNYVPSSRTSVFFMFELPNGIIDHRVAQRTYLSSGRTRDCVPREKSWLSVPTGGCFIIVSHNGQWVPGLKEGLFDHSIQKSACASCHTSCLLTTGPHKYIIYYHVASRDSLLPRHTLRSFHYCGVPQRDPLLSFHTRVSFTIVLRKGVHYHSVAHLYYFLSCCTEVLF
jgi:hypothetical protein